MLSPVSHWTRKLRRDGVLVEMRVLQWTDQWETAERNWIARYRSEGAKLLNVEDGGRGSWAKGTPKPKRTGNRIFADAMRIAGKVASKFEARGQQEHADLVRLCVKIIKRKREDAGRFGQDALNAFDQAFTLDNLYGRALGRQQHLAAV